MQNGEALKCYRKAKDTANCVRLLEKEGRYDDAVRMCRNPKDALKQASKYASKGIELSSELSPDNLSYTYARKYANRKDKTTLVEVLEYMPNVLRRARFLKEGGLFEKAFNVYVDNNELDDAYRLASAQGFFAQGIKVAQENEDVRRQAEFVFHQVQAEYFMKRTDADTPSLPPDYRFKLHSLFKLREPNIKAHASLLLGIGEDDVALCRTAHTLFLQQHNKVAAMEAFDAVAKVGKYYKPNVRQVLDACSTAKEVQNALVNHSDLNQLVKQAIIFYGLQKVSGVYLMPANHNMWVSAQLQDLDKDGDTDLDGMLKVQYNETRMVLASHVGGFVNRWLEKYNVPQMLQQQLTSFKLHEDISKKHFLLHLYGAADLPLLSQYLESIISYCNLGLLKNDTGMCHTATSLLLTVFSPQVAIFLPLQKRHVLKIRNALSMHKSFQERIRSEIDRDEQNRIDAWLSAWRACAISEGHTKRVEDVLQKLEQRVNDASTHKPVLSPTSPPPALSMYPSSQAGSTQQSSAQAMPQSLTSPTTTVAAGIWKGHRFEPPPAFIYWKLEKQYYHIFSCWLYSCSLIRDENEPLWAAKQAIYHFLGRISQRRALSISVMNLVDVLIVHCMSLFAMLTHLNYFYNVRQAKCTVPMLYKDCVRLFDDLNTYGKGSTYVFTACADKVKRSIWRRKDRILFSECIKLLEAALSILLGTYRRDSTIPVEDQKKFKVLAYALRNEKVVSSGAARHCLVLSLTLFANLMLYQARDIFEETYRKFGNIFYQCSQQETPPQFVQDGLMLFRSPYPPQRFDFQVFQYIRHLLQDGSSSGGPTTAKMFYDDRKKINFVPLPDMRKPAVGHPQNVPSSQGPGLVQSTAADHLPPSTPAGELPPQAVTDAGHTLPPNLQTPPIANLPGDSSQPSLGLSTGDALLEMQQLDEFGPSVEWREDTEKSPAFRELPAVQLEEKGKGDELAAEGEEEEEGEEAPGMFASHKPKASPLENIDPALMHPDIVTKQYCNVCGVPLRVEHVVDDEEEEEGVSTPEVDQSTEVYEAHVSSETHSQNYTLHSKFKEDSDGQYSSMVKEVTDLITLCEQAKASSLARIIDDMKEAVEHFEMTLSKRSTNLQWKQGIHVIEKATERFQQLLHQANREYQEIMANRTEVPEQMHIGEGEGAEESDTELDAEINKTQDVIDDHPLALRSEETKMRSRVKKKNRKGKK